MPKQQLPKKAFYLIIGIGVFALIIYAIVRANSGPGAYDFFAQCLTDRGVKMYGAYWCPHCQNQKKVFGKSFTKITYIECALPGNSRAQSQECIDAKISSYPTWTFADGTRIEGEMSLEALAEKSTCQMLPESTNAPTQ